MAKRNEYLQCSQAHGEMVYVVCGIRNNGISRSPMLGQCCLLSYTNIPYTASRITYINVNMPQDYVHQPISLIVIFRNGVRVCDEFSIYIALQVILTHCVHIYGPRSLMGTLTMHPTKDLFIHKNIHVM